MISRRRFLRAAAAALVAGPVSAGLYGWRLEPEWLEVTGRDLPVAGLPPALKGATLLHVSDLHVGPRVPDRYIARVFDRAAALEPDFVAMTGDWITFRGPGQYTQLQRLLERFPRGRLGTIGILGNHDYGFGWRMEHVADRVASIAARAGVRMLRNEAQRVHGLQFLGLEDVWGPRFAPEAMLARHGSEPASIALCHNPDGADRPVWGDFRGWILAGHTHGGQCRPPFLPPPIIPVNNPRYTSGVVRVDEHRTLYISRGVGYLMRFRFLVRPEITVFRLTAAPRVGPRA